MRPSGRSPDPRWPTIPAAAARVLRGYRLATAVGIVGHVHVHHHRAGLPRPILVGTHRSGYRKTLRCQQHALAVGFVVFDFDTAGGDGGVGHGYFNRRMQPLGRAVDLSDRPAVADCAGFGAFGGHFGAALGGSQQGSFSGGEAGLPDIDPRALGYGNLFQTAQYRSKA